MTYRISVDSGGTFTDGVFIKENGEAITAKAHTTPHDPSVGTADCIRKLALELGTTLASNILIYKINNFFSIPY